MLTIVIIWCSLGFLRHAIKRIAFKLEEPSAVMSLCCNIVKYLSLQKVLCYVMLSLELLEEGAKKRELLRFLFPIIQLIKH